LDTASALLLGLVQGLTEFLPVSSSGHLVIGETLLGAQSEGILFEIAVHVATLGAVLWFYRRRVAELTSGALRGGREEWTYAGKLALASVPAAVVGLGAGALLESLFDVPAVAGVSLLVTGLVLWTTRTTLPRAHATQPSWTQAFWIGCAQAVAIIPGISRSGSTVAAALALGVSPLAAAEFSFLLSIPAIGGAALLQLSEIGELDAATTRALAVGGVAALASGVLALHAFVRLLRSQVFYRFAYYTWAAGAVFLLWLALRS